MPFPENGVLWMNGKMVPWKEARVHVMTHALHYGSGVFEGIRSYETSKGSKLGGERGSAVFRLEEHLDRLMFSARLYNMQIPYSKDDLREAVRSVLRENDLGSAYVRPIVFYGYGRLGVDPTGLPVDVAIGAWPWGAYLGEEAATKGARIVLSPWRRILPDALPVNAKATGQYISSILGGFQARRHGYHEALFLDNQGHVSEGSGENFFIVKNGRILTPGTESSILEGITRDSVMTIARDLGYEVVVKPLVLGEVFGADETFFTGTAVEVTPVVEVEDRTIGSGAIGEVTRQIRETYRGTVRGEHEKYAAWLTPV